MLPSRALYQVATEQLDEVRAAMLATTRQVMEEMQKRSQIAEA
jgi:hypothetical protein